MADLDDWVTRRLKCSEFEIFKQIQAGVLRDIAARMASQLQPPAIVFKPAANANPREDNFKIVRLGSGIEASLEFTIEGKNICVKDGTGKQFLAATLTLNDECECRLKVGARELEYWQFRKLALEDFLMF